MKTVNLTDNLIQLDRYRFVNAFLVREDDGFTLVDTTLGGAADGLIAAAATAGARRSGCPAGRSGRSRAS